MPPPGKAPGICPVSVKTRIGISHSQAEEWLGFLLAQGLSALTVHGRTVAQQSDGAADWGAVATAVRLRDAAGLPTRIVGNGDVRTAPEFQRRAGESGADGVMVGRGIFENLFLFRSIKSGPGEHEFSRLSTGDKIAWFQRHIDLHSQTWGTAARFDMLKKFVKTYLRSFEGASRLVDAVMRTRTHAAATEVLSAWLANREAPAAVAR